jgi:hypothetical protein
MEEQQQLTASEKYYQNHLNRMREYNRQNKELVNERNRQRYKNMVENDEKHQKYLEKRREVYKRKKMKNNQQECVIHDISLGVPFSIPFESLFSANVKICGTLKKWDSDKKEYVDTNE